MRLSVTNAEALSGVLTLSRRINSNLQFLRQALNRDADFIVTRWKRKWRVKRTEFLSNLWPQESDGRPLEYKDGGGGLYDKKWAAVHFINDHTKSSVRDPKEVFKGSKQATDSLEEIMVPRLHALWGLCASQDMVSRYRTTWLLPYLDIESLGEDLLRLLSLLHYRTAYAPVRYLFVTL